MTPLQRLIVDRIRHDGPIGLDRYMALALGHPALGYYATRDPFGQAGDFTTAPEISQMFGELIGLWCAAVWEGMGSPDRVVLAELGPGRGTLMADALRASRALPQFATAVELHLVETSPVLRAQQRDRLAGSGRVSAWHEGIDSLPDGPILVVANEFFDALPIKHFIGAAGRWHERLIGLGPEGDLAFGLAPDPEPALSLEAPERAVLEVGVEAQVLAGRLASRIAAQGGAALIVDYGHERTGFGETLQAVRGHRSADPLREPGEADLTAHVDFAALSRAAVAAGATTYGPVEQGAFLAALGIRERASRLAAARSDQAEAIAAALARLIGQGDAEHPGMGRLFKVLAVAAPTLGPLPGFPDVA